MSRTLKKICFAISVGALGGLLLSPHHRISSSPYLAIFSFLEWADFFMGETKFFYN
jgi:hypothetical protein